VSSTIISPSGHAPFFLEVDLKNERGRIGRDYQLSRDKVRRELAAAEQDLQMSLPLPMSGLIYEDSPSRNRPPEIGGSVLPMPRQIRGGA
jgi:hypothetical protein